METCGAGGSPLAQRAVMVWDARVFAIYVHNLNPVALPLWGGAAVRWYGMAYLVGFVAGKWWFTESTDFDHFHDRYFPHA